MTLHYAIRPADPGAHLFHVTLTVEQPDPAGQKLMLPAWIPGSYMIREFARNLVRITALTGNHKLRLTKLDKHTWQAVPVTGPLTLAYEVYAWDLSVRAAHLDPTHGFFNGTSVFLLPLGREHDTCTVDILPPAGRAFADWKLVTGLTPARGTRRGHFGTYTAADYDELIDCPVEMGCFVHAEFKVLGVPHEIAVTGRVPKLDLARLTADLARLCETQIRFFEPRHPCAPFDRYRFLTLAVDDGYGGLEHRNSTALLCKRDDLPYLGMKDGTDGYRRFLELASHEYFHTWNVKRIKPAAFMPYDLARENHTRLLWAFEGFTSYYDDLLLTRAGLLTEAQYLDTLAETLTTVLQQTSRLKQSVADSSFDAWIKHYRQDENAPNSVVSYYRKGALVALALDLTIRAASRGRKSLDDAMRQLWQRCRDAGPAYAGVAEDEMAEVIRSATGLDVTRLLREWTEGTRDLDFAPLFAPFGIQCERKPALEQAHFVLLGVKTEAAGSDCRVQAVYDGTPAQVAGVSAGDVLVAIDGLRVAPTNVDRLLARYAPGDEVELLAFRRDELQRFTVTLAQVPPKKYVLTAEPRTTVTARRLKAGWLNSSA